MLVYVKNASDKHLCPTSLTNTIIKKNNDGKKRRRLVTESMHQNSRNHHKINKYQLNGCFLLPLDILFVRSDSANMSFNTWLKRGRRGERGRQIPNSPKWLRFLRMRVRLWGRWIRPPPHVGWGFRVSSPRKEFRGQIMYSNMVYLDS